MKNLRSFTKFDINGFLAGKQLAFIGARDLFLYDEKGEVTKQIIGTKIDVVIISDSKAEASKSNVYEKMVFKLMNVNKEDIKFNFNELVWPTIIKKVSVYGQFQNSLSIEIGGIDSVENIRAKERTKKDEWF